MVKKGWLSQNDLASQVGDLLFNPDLSDIESQYFKWCSTHFNIGLVEDSVPFVFNL